MDIAAALALGYNAISQFEHSAFEALTEEGPAEDFGARMAAAMSAKAQERLAAKQQQARELERQQRARERAAAGVYARKRPADAGNEPAVAGDQVREGH